MTEISKTFVVRTSPALAWEFLTDPRRVAACLPGAAITGQRDERTHDGTITVKVGPVSATYRGTLHFDRLDPVERRAELTAAGQDVRGKGGAQLRLTSRLIERSSGETEVSVVSHVDVMGVLAQFGRGMIQDVSDQMFGKFVEALRSQLEAPAAATTVAASAVGAEGRPASVPSAAPVEPLDVLSLGSTVVGRAVVRAVRRPAVWAAVAGLFAAAVGYRLIRNRREMRRAAAAAA